MKLIGLFIILAITFIMIEGNAQTGRVTKMSYAEAKKVCLAENPKLKHKDKELKQCIKNKRKHFK